MDELRHGRRANLNISELISRQNQMENALKNMFSEMHDSGFKYAEDKLNKRNPKQKIARDHLRGYGHLGQ